MKKQQTTKAHASKAPAAETLQAGAGNDAWHASNPAKHSDARPEHWDRYVDSRLKQFCLR